jgi:hypothetical protein
VNEPKRFLLRKPRHSVGLKLSRFDVEDMRRWVRTEGFGLPIPTQVKWLRAGYPHVSYTTIREILMNATWCDPTYDRDTRLPGAPVIPQFGLLASLLALLQLFFGEITCSPSHSTDR